MPISTWMSSKGIMLNEKKSQSESNTYGNNSIYTTFLK